MSDLAVRLRFFLTHPEYRDHRVRSWLRLLTWRVRCAARIPAKIDLPVWHARFYLPPRWGGEGTAMLYVFREAYEAELRHLGVLLRAGGVFIDAGANCGIFTVAAGKLVGPTGRVMAIEPTSRAASTLRENILLNSLSNVVVFEAALTEKVGTARLYHNRGPVAASVTEEEKGGDFDEVKTVSISSISEGEAISRLDVVKLDIEGAEEAALRGGTAVMERHRPIVIFEMNPGAAEFGGAAPDAAWHLLAEWGYTLHQMSRDGKLTVMDGLPEHTGWEFRNFVAIHPGGVQPVPGRAR